MSISDSTPTPSSGSTPPPRTGASATTKALLFGAAAAAAVLAFGPALGRHAVRPPEAITSTPPAGACGLGVAPARAAAELVRARLSGALSHEQILRGGPGDVYMSLDLGVKAAQKAGARPPLDIAIVVDHSGSMAGEKLAAAQRAAQGIVDRLQDTDRVALVQYDSQADTLARLTPLAGGARERLRTLIAGMQPAGGTNLHDGLQLGLAELGEAGRNGRLNRVVLMSDGQANAGITDPAALGGVSQNAANRGIRVTTIGMGLDYNEDLMERLAENGRGNYYFVKDAASLENVFAQELRTLEATVATNAELRLEPACAGVEIIDVFGYNVRRERGAVVVVPLADLFGGDSRRVLVRLRVPTGAEGRVDLVRARLSYTDAVDERAGSGQLVLGAAFTSDARAVEASVDKSVMGAVVQMQGAAAVRQAAVSYERGDRDGARAFLAKKEADLRGLANKYALPASAPAQQALGDLPRFAEEMKLGEASSTAGKSALKMRKKAASDQLKAAW